MLKSFLKVVIAAFIIVFTLNALQLGKSLFYPRPLSEENFFAEIPIPTNIAHRGASGDYPENTIVAFEKALEQGAHVLELDVWLTKDDEVLVIHDRTVDRTTEAEGKVRDFTLVEIQGLDAAYNFKPEEDYPFRGKGIYKPTLAEVLQTSKVITLCKKSGDIVDKQLNNHW